MNRFNFAFSYLLGVNFSGKYPKKINKLSQKAKRKRLRQQGGKK